MNKIIFLHSFDLLPVVISMFVSWMAKPCLLLCICGSFLFIQCAFASTAILLMDLADCCFIMITVARLVYFSWSYCRGGLALYSSSHYIVNKISYSSISTPSFYFIIIKIYSTKFYHYNLSFVIKY